MMTTMKFADHSVRCLYADVSVDYPSSLLEKYLVGELLAESTFCVLKACTDR